MRIRFLGLNGRQAATLREHARRRIAFTLGRFRPAITEVCVRFDEVDRPGGGRLARCRIRATIEPAGAVTADLHDSEAHTAIARAVDRLARMVREVVRSTGGSRT